MNRWFLEPLKKNSKALKTVRIVDSTAKTDSKSDSFHLIRRQFLRNRDCCSWRRPFKKTCLLVCVTQSLRFYGLQLESLMLLLSVEKIISLTMPSFGCDSVIDSQKHFLRKGKQLSRRSYLTLEHLYNSISWAVSVSCPWDPEKPCRKWALVGNSKSARRKSSTSI